MTGVEMSKTGRYWLQQRGRWHVGLPEAWIANMSVGFVNLDDALDHLEGVRSRMSSEHNPFRIFDRVTGEEVARVTA